MDVTVEVKGLAELEARLQELSALAQQKLMRRVLRKVAKPMMERAKANARTLGASGALSRSIAVVTRKERGQEVAKVSVTSKAKDRTALYVHNTVYGRRRKGIFYGWMVDQGHRAGTKNPVQVQGRPWWTPAVNGAQGRVTSDFVLELERAIKRMEKRRSRIANPDALVPE